MIQYYKSGMESSAKEIHSKVYDTKKKKVVVVVDTFLFDTYAQYTEEFLLLAFLHVFLRSM